jgi:hypothetical protein
MKLNILGLPRRPASRGTPRNDEQNWVLPHTASSLRTHHEREGTEGGEKKDHHQGSIREEGKADG